MTLVLALVLWLPRGFKLNQFVAVDERSWLTRSANFYLALTQGHLAATFQRYHPGVTTMWLGMAGFLWRYPDYPAQAAGQVTDMSEGIEDFLRAHHHPPMEMLAAGRTFVVLFTVLVLLGAFWVTADLLGLLPALAGFLLIAFEPFLLGLTRMLHVDGLSSTLMFVALLSFLRFRDGGRHKRYLIASGSAAGLAWLSKSPALFLGPFVALLVLIDLAQTWRARRTLRWTDLHPAFLDLLLWTGVGVAVFVLLWPAMWVTPWDNLRNIFAAAGESAAAGHSKALFFNGQTYTGDPGPWFYPITYLWRTTPIVLAGLAFAVVMFLFRQTPFDQAARRRTTGQLALFALLFTLFMTLGAKKFPRYLLPAYMPLDLIAGLGWLALAHWVSSRLSGATRHWAMPVMVAVPILIQAGIAIPQFPYYFTYYNPLLGGDAKAPQVMMIGLGEGLDQAARYLNAKPGAATLTVAAWYRGGSFDYIFNAHAVDIDQFFRADYAVLYAHQWQRQVPDERLLDYFAGLTPEKSIILHGIDYAQIYNLRTAPPPAYFVDWDKAIRLVSDDVPDHPVAPGEHFVVRFHFYSIGPVDRNLNVVVRLVDANGKEVARSEGWPFGTPTSTWQPGSVYVDGHDFTLPAGTAPGYYQIEVGFYDPATKKLFTPTVAGTDQKLADLLPVDYLRVGPLPVTPALSLDPPADLGGKIRLLGANVIPQTGATTSGTEPIRITSGSAITLTLFWQPLHYRKINYTVFVHIVGPDGQIVAQVDRQPVNGAIPTTMWHDDETIVDSYTLQIPAGAPAGAYQIRTGMYDLATLQRLPVSRNERQTGDSITLATLAVK